MDCSFEFFLTHPTPTNVKFANSGGIRISILSFWGGSSIPAHPPANSVHLIRRISYVFVPLDKFKFTKVKDLKIRRLIPVDGKNPAPNRSGVRKIRN